MEQGDVWIWSRPHKDQKDTGVSVSHRGWLSLDLFRDDCNGSPSNSPTKYSRQIRPDKMVASYRPVKIAGHISPLSPTSDLWCCMYTIVTNECRSLTVFTISVNPPVNIPPHLLGRLQLVYHSDISPCLCMCLSLCVSSLSIHRSFYLSPHAISVRCCLYLCLSVSLSKSRLSFPSHSHQSTVSLYFSLYFSLHLFLSVTNFNRCEN